MGEKRNWIMLGPPEAIGCGVMLGAALLGLFGLMFAAAPTWLGKFGPALLFLWVTIVTSLIIWAGRGCWGGKLRTGYFSPSYDPVAFRIEWIADNLASIELRGADGKWTQQSWQGIVLRF